MFLPKKSRPIQHKLLEAIPIFCILGIKAFSNKDFVKLKSFLPGNFEQFEQLKKSYPKGHD